ncbi:MAG: hypothetical protein HYY18_19670 [Planctomycetes bacterium]|nr:hypothetical protein [Planctomycetota bacterium]
MNASTLHPGGTCGFSDDAESIARLESLQTEGQAIPEVRSRQSRLLKSWNEAIVGALAPGWDGYEGSSVSLPSALASLDFLRLLPSEVPAPEISIDPDGELAFDWQASADTVFSVSVGGNGRLSYAGKFGANKTHGTEQLTPELPDPIRSGLRRLFGGGHNH